METKHKGSQACSKCYKLFKEFEIVVRKVNHIAPDTFIHFHCSCALHDLQNPCYEIYLDKGKTEEIQIQKTA